MRKSLREALRMIRDSGATNVAVEQGGKHTLVRFTNADGWPQTATLHRGEITTHRAERALRSQLRNGGRL